VNDTPKAAECAVPKFIRRDSKMTVDHVDEPAEHIYKKTIASADLV
jgi:hypothetical protein